MFRLGSMGGVFISYRGEDSQSYGALIYHELSRRFGLDQVFLDSESISAGEDFVEVLLGRLRRCSVVLAVIGPRWLTSTDEAGRRRIDSPEDWIRHELIEAFAQGLRVIPILTDNVEIPAESELPTDIAALSRCQYLRLHHRNAGHDLARIAEELAGLDQELTTAARHYAGVPRQLPAAPRLFTGRARELAELTGLLKMRGDAGGAVVISAIGGAGGIGKTALALHWAHHNTQRFPDGQLYVNLRGFDPAAPPMPPEVAMRGFLDALGVDTGTISADLDAQAALYRSLVVGKHILVVLDNARDTAQVTPLLPGTASCTVLVTSRHQLSGLITTHYARPLALDVLDEDEAWALLTCHLGQGRVAAEPEAVAVLVDHCAGLPLALGIVAARALAHPTFPLAVLAEELRDAADRLDLLNAGELSANLRGVFSCSYQALAPQTAYTSTLLGLAPGPDISLPAIASLIGESSARTRALLQDLETASLVQQYIPGRYRMHDLTRLYAAERARSDHSKETRHAALRRLVDFYLHAAYTGERALNRHRQPIELGPPAVGCLSYVLDTPEAAMAWFGTEQLCLLAAQRLAADQSWCTLVWQLAWALESFHWRRGHVHDPVVVWRAALLAADRLGEPATQALVHRHLGRAYIWAEMHTEAFHHLWQALTLSEQNGDTLAQAAGYRALSWACGQQNDHQEALALALRALPLYQTLNNPVWEANGLNSVGRCYTRLGHYEQARTYCESALTLYRDHGDQYGEAEALDELGLVAHHAGQHARALTYFRQTLNLQRKLSNTLGEANTLVRLGDVHAALGDHDDACDAWQQALKLYQTQHRTTEVEHIRQQMAALGDR